MTLNIRLNVHTRPCDISRKGFFFYRGTGLACRVHSELYQKLCDPKTGLYFQSPLYVYDYLKTEIKTGKLQ